MFPIFLYAMNIFRRVNGALANVLFVKLITLPLLIPVQCPNIVRSYFVHN